MTNTETVAQQHNGKWLHVIVEEILEEAGAKIVTHGNRRSNLTGDRYEWCGYFYLRPEGFQLTYAMDQYDPAEVCYFEEATYDGRYLELPGLVFDLEEKEVEQV